ncbi:MAG: hypothetical protein AAGF20_07440 [Pseudomonadota bacterium]
MKRLTHGILVSTLGMALCAAGAAAQDWSDPFGGADAAKSWSKPTAQNLPTLGEVPAGHVAIMDVNGFDKPVPAYSFKRPEGWVVQEATIAWSEQPCGGMTAMTRMRLQHQNGGIIRSGGLRGWMQGADQMRQLMMMNGMQPPSILQNCPESRIISADAFLRNAVHNSRRNARIISFRPRPDIVQLELQKFEREKPYYSQDAIKALDSAKIEAAELIIEHDGANGREREVLLTEMATFRVPDAPIPMTLQVTSGIMSLSAPVASFDQSALETVWKTTVSLDSYLPMQQRKNNELDKAIDRELVAFRQQAEARLQQHKQRRQGGRVLQQSTNPASMRAMQQAGGDSWSVFNNKMKAMDTMSTDMSDAMMDTTTVYDPYHGYDVAVQGTGVDVWQTPTGNIFTTDSSLGYDPASEGVDAVQLDPLGTDTSSSSTDIGWAITN